MVKQVIVDGIKFTRDERTGYYLGSKKIDGRRPRLHVYIWEKYNGSIPKGFLIHHKDHNKNNNDISNLMLIPKGKHSEHHINEYIKEHFNEMINNLNENARPEATEWHKSEKGKEWHKRNYEKIKDKFHQKEKYTCEYCGKEFETLKGKNRFCSNNCKSAWRRKEGLDNETRMCIICGREFITNRYSKAKTCSAECRGKFRWLNKQKSRE